MKKLILFVCLVMATTLSFAQLSWNVKAGVNMSTLNSIDGDYFDTKTKVGYQVSFGMEYAFTEMWSIQPSLQFITRGGKIEAKGDGDYVNVKFNPMYLNVPVMGAARFKVSDGMNLVVSAGPYFAFGVGGKGKYDMNVEDERESGEGDMFGSDGAFERFDFGLGVGVTAEFGKILVGIDSSFGLLNASKESDPLFDDIFEPKNMTFGLSLGYKF